MTSLLRLIHSGRQSICTVLRALLIRGENREREKAECSQSVDSEVPRDGGTGPILLSQMEAGNSAGVTVRLEKPHLQKAALRAGTALLLVEDRRGQRYLPRVAGGPLVPPALAELSSSFRAAGSSAALACLGLVSP